jgi:predicted secreted protein
MRDFVQGNDVLIEVKLAGDADYLPFACAEEVNIEMNSEILEISTSDTGAWDEFDYSGKNNWNASLSGVTVLRDEVDQLHYPLETFLLQVRSQKLGLRITFTDRQGFQQIGYGEAVIPSSSLGANAQQNDFSRFGIKFQGTGPLDLSGYVPPNDNPMNTERLFWITSGAEPNLVQDNKLIAIALNKILIVSRESDDKLEIIDAGEPTEKQVRLNNVAGTLRWKNDFDADEQIYAIIKTN